MDPNIVTFPLSPASYVLSAYCLNVADCYGSPILSFLLNLIHCVYDVIKCSDTYGSVIVFFLR